MKRPEYLGCLREQKQLSRADVAKELGVSWQTVRRWELGYSTPMMENLEALSRLYDVPVSILAQNEIEVEAILEGLDARGQTQVKTPEESDTEEPTQTKAELPVKAKVDEKLSGKPTDRIILIAGRILISLSLTIFFILGIIFGMQIQNIRTSEPQETAAPMKTSNPAQERGQLPFGWEEELDSWTFIP